MAAPGPTGSLALGELKCPVLFSLRGTSHASCQSPNNPVVWTERGDEKTPRGVLNPQIALRPSASTLGYAGKKRKAQRGQGDRANEERRWGPCASTPRRALSLLGKKAPESPRKEQLQPRWVRVGERGPLPLSHRSTSSCPKEPPGVFARPKPGIADLCSGQEFFSPENESARLPEHSLAWTAFPRMP